MVPDADEEVFSGGRLDSVQPAQSPICQHVSNSICINLPSRYGGRIP